MVDEGKVIQPKSVAIHTGNYSDHLQRFLGSIDFNTVWNNWFSQMEGCVKLIAEIKIASEPRIITDPRTGKQINKNAIINTVKHPELILDPVAVDNFNNLWYGGCFLSKQRNPSNPTQFIKKEMRFHFDKKKLNPNDKYQEVIPLPALCNMVPRESISKATWGIKISESIPFRYAFDTCVYDTVIIDGGFHYISGGKMIGRFKPEDMKSLTKFTNRVGEPFYNSTMKILKDKTIKEWSIITIDIHRIINFFENGSDEDSINQHEIKPEREKS